MYEWHDLRKNPNDVPQEWEHDILIATSCSDHPIGYGKAKRLSYMNESWRDFFEREYLTIAWKRIEPFIREEKRQPFDRSLNVSPKGDKGDKADRTPQN